VRQPRSATWQRPTWRKAEAALRRARETQRDTILTSPIDGVIVERNYDAGSLVGPGDKPVVAVADLRSLKLEAGVSELEAGPPSHLACRRESRFRRGPGEVFEGRLAAIAPEVDPRNRHFTIEVRTTNPGTLLSGMYATATIRQSALQTSLRSHATRHHHARRDAASC
jgi:multidrug efflux pump subunit AcrA (membrane-fusion protein)